MVNSDGDVLQFMFKYGNYILILPKFNFNQKLVHCSKSRLFATIVFMLLIGNGYIITVIGRFNIVYPLIEAIDRFLDFSTYTLLTTTNIIIILDSLIKRHAWEELLKLLLATNIRITKNQRLLYLTLFILMHVYYLLLLFFDNYIWLNAAEAYLYQYYILRILQEYLCLLMVFFMGMINSMLRSRFRELNHFLMSTHHITHQKNPKKQFLNLYRAVMCYNRIFGWQHLLIVAYAGFSFLDNVDTALIYTDKYSSRVLSYEKFFIVLCVASVAMVKVTAIAVSSDLTKREADRVMIICYTNQQYKELAKYARDLKVEFTAAGFFEINRTTLFSILSVVTTYFIVILQFRK